MPVQETVIQSITISIFDTTLPEIGNLVKDFAEKGSIHWIFDGGDDKLLPMMPSRLEFDMEVSIEDSLNVLVYDYLFTGNETRYSCIMHNQDDEVIWRGFLIPEEYVEPYDKGTFFIHFTATDGLGRLKGQTLPYTFYRAKQSVPKIIADCLKKTGMQLPISISTAVENAIATNKWENIYADARQWSKDKPTNCYDILQAILSQIGATLFQQNDKWHIIAWNKRGVFSHTARNYDYNGVPIADFKLNAGGKNALWYATPSLSIKAPFKEVSVKENLLESIDLFPTRLISQPWTMETSSTSAPAVKYWKTIGAGKVELVDVSNWAFNEWDGEPFEQDATVGYTATAPSIPALSDYPAAVDNYITFVKSIFMKGEEFVDFDFAWDMRIYNPGADNIDAYVNNANYYEITLNGNVIISNRKGFPARKNFLWTGDIVWAEDYTTLQATVKVRKFYMPEDGFVNIKFFHPGMSAAPPPVYKRLINLSFTYRKDINSLFKKRRIIDYTSTKEVTINNGGSVFEQMVNSFIYQPAIDPALMTEIPFTLSNAETSSITISVVNYLTIMSNLDKIYVKRADSNFYEFIYQIRSIGIFLNKIQIIFDDAPPLIQEDSLYVYSGAAGSPQNTAVVQAREQWQKTTNSNGVDRLGNVLAETHHDIYPAPILTMEGAVKGLIQPRDVLLFELKNQRRHFIPIRIDITPNENTTSLTAVEYKDEKITDYGG